MNKFVLAQNELQKICSSKQIEECEYLFCLLHNPDYLGDHQGSHVCLGCSLNDSIEMVDRFLLETKLDGDDSSDKIEYVFTIYILLLYLTVEKLHTIFKFIGITWEYVEEKWTVLVEIRKWANFIKHPKGFLFTHHPSYQFEDEPRILNSELKYLDFNFVSKFYFREDETKFKQTLLEIGNKSNIVVLIPCPHRISKEFVKVCHEFCDKIKNNEHFKEILKTKTIIDE
jgi:hypothetical protein